MDLSVSSVESLIHREKLNLQKKLYVCYKKSVIKRRFLLKTTGKKIYQPQNIESYWHWFGGIFLVTVLFTWLPGKKQGKIGSGLNL